MSDIGRRVKIHKNRYPRHVGKTGRIVGTDTRPIGYGEGDWLIIALDEKDPNDPQLGVARAQHSEVEFLHAE